MQNLHIEEAIQKNRKTKLEIKKELNESIINGKSNKNKEMLEKVNDITTSENVMKVVQEFEKVIMNKKSNIWLTYHQGQIFQKFKKEQFVSMVSQFGISKSTIRFKIALFKLITDYSKIKKENASEFK